MSDFKVQEVIEQASTFDGKFSLPIDPLLLLNIINHMGSYDQDEINEMDNPRRMVVRVIIEAREID